MPNKIKINRIHGQIERYGLLIKNDDPNAYILGKSGSSLPQAVLKEDGQWDNWLPVYEPQFNDEFDSYGCTVWGSLNAIEIMIKRLTNFESNFSERFNYILAKVRPPGADPHHVLESIRQRGVIPESLLPFSAIKTFKEFLQPDPMTKELLEEGMKFGYEVKHEYVWNPWSRISKTEKVKLIKNALRFSPVCVSVTAWFEKDGVYVDNGRPNTHWVVLFGWTSKGWKCFDSYKHEIKIVDFDHNIELAKRIHLEPNNYLPQVSLMTKILNLLSKLMSLLTTEPEKPQEAPEQPVETVEVPREAETAPEPKKPSIHDFCLAIQTFEGWFPPGTPGYPNGSLTWRTKNPGALRYANQAGNIGQLNGFAVFPNYETGFRALRRQIEIAVNGTSKVYKPTMTFLQFFSVYAPTSDNNYPEKYAKFIADRLGVSVNYQIKNLI